MWPFLEGSPTMPLTIVNTLGSERKERTASVTAVIDTGYSGFVLLSERLFNRLGFDELMNENTSGRLADGSLLRMRSTYGTLRISDLELDLHGVVETCKGAETTLLGMDGIQGLALTIDSCAQESSARMCVLGGYPIA